MIFKTFDEIILSIYAIAYLLLCIYVYRHFSNTRFYPSLYLSFLFLLCFLAIIFTLIALLLPISSQYIFYSASLIFAILATNIMVIFISTIAEYRLTAWAIADSIICLIYIGYSINNFFSSGFQLTSWANIFTPAFQFYLFITAFIVIIQLRKFLMELRIFAQKKSQIVKFVIMVAIVNIIIILISFSQDLMVLSWISVNGSLIIFGFLYLFNPDVVFIAPSRIFQFNLINGMSGMPIVGLDSKKGARETISLFASFLLQRELAGATIFPVELNLGDKHILIEQRQIGTQLVMAFAIASASLDYFRESLKFTLTLFEKQYGKKYSDDPTDVEAIQKFESQLKKIFAYAYIEEAENSI